MAQHLEPGGTPGGLGTFVAGGALTAISAWFFVDSVRVTSYGSGWMTGLVGGSAGVIFLPLVIAVIALFYDAKKMWAWALFGIAVAIIGVEILSKLQFFFNLKLSHFLIMLGGFAAGIGLMLRSLKAIGESTPPTPPDLTR